MQTTLNQKHLFQELSQAHHWELHRTFMASLIITLPSFHILPLFLYIGWGKEKISSDTIECTQGNRNHSCTESQFVANVPRERIAPYFCIMKKKTDKAEK